MKKAKGSNSTPVNNHVKSKAKKVDATRKKVSEAKTTGKKRKGRDEDTSKDRQVPQNSSKKQHQRHEQPVSQSSHKLVQKLATFQWKIAYAEHILNGICSCQRRVYSEF